MKLSDSSLVFQPKCKRCHEPLSKDGELWGYHPGCLGKPFCQCPESHAGDCNYDKPSNHSKVQMKDPYFDIPIYP